MKKSILCLLVAAVLLLAGCKQEAATNITDKDALCPYAVVSQEAGLCVRLDVQSLPQLQWQATVFPENICQLAAREDAPEGERIYDIIPAEDGIATVTVVATDAEGNDAGRFTLQVDLQVEGGKAKGISAEHQQSELFTEQLGDATYKWEVNAEGTLLFRFTEDTGWDVEAEPSDVCNVSEILLTPSGCRFEATALAAGTATVRIYHPEKENAYLVTLQVDEALQITVAAVEEQTDG